MTRQRELKPEFVELMPPALQLGVLYISIQYKSVQHLCCCGCGRTVVTPLSPTGWSMTYDGRTVSLWPSVGNWQKECGSHYFIENNRVRWSRRWSQDEIIAGIERDSRDKSSYYEESKPNDAKPSPRTARNRSQTMRSEAEPSDDE